VTGTVVHFTYKGIISEYVVRAECTSHVPSVFLPGLSTCCCATPSVASFALLLRHTLCLVYRLVVAPRPVSRLSPCCSSVRLAVPRLSTCCSSRPARLSRRFLVFSHTLCLCYRIFGCCSSVCAHRVVLHPHSVSALSTLSSHPCACAPRVEGYTTRTSLMLQRGK
jgi:hypothetical protein